MIKNYGPEYIALGQGTSREGESFLAPIRNASHIFLYHLSIHKRIEKGRDDVWEHTLRAVEYGRYLLRHEEGEEEIVIPALYAHDIGWSSVSFDDFREASPGRKSKAVSLSLHMKYGAVLAREILEDLGFHPQKTHTIVSIIAIHDEPDKVFAMKDPSATLIVEADRMDRYGPESISRFTAMDGEDYLRGGISGKKRRHTCVRQQRIQCLISKIRQGQPYS